MKFSSFLKSLVFNILYIPLTLVFSALAVCTLLSPISWTLWVAKMWSRTVRYLARIVVGIKVSIDDKYKVLDSKENYIVASAHQSAFETILFYDMFKMPMFVLKKELIYIPVFGILAWKIHIAIDRGNKKSLNQILTTIPKAFAKGRDLIIFPTGTRNKFDAKKDDVDYKSGIFYIAKANPDVKIVPVSLNTGKVWAKKAFIKKAGDVKITIHQPYTFANSESSKNKKLFIENLKNFIFDN